ncbi:MAG: hypothetical protein GC146_09740 [Limimaricola sp.]|uniref:hypothetical protein n=1 Tax=Limimaricola sp. TaxID=2211665 RepID=UPI001D27F4AE|nr:hypothetical protein [Limimaricola sp.]MBI1417489.1 hypothetical protein [Limimaricola sp.]
MTDHDMKMVGPCGPRRNVVRPAIRLLSRAGQIAVIGLIGAMPAHAFEPSLSDSEVASTLDQAKTMVADHAHGLIVKDYVLFDRPNPLHITDESRLVDAVVVDTPRQRLLSNAYLTYFQDKTLSTGDARKMADNLAGKIAFRVFAHAPSLAPDQRHFLQDFGQATLTLTNGQALQARPADLSNPAEDFFILANGNHVFRWLGAFSYVFDLGPVAQNAQSLAALKGTLTFTDSGGRTYTHDVDLGQYR